jgi:hypothetical protein
VSAKTPDAWANRIVGSGDEAPGQLLANPRNWRTHPRAQRLAFAGLLDQVGVVAAVMVNRRTGHLVDGHLRVDLAMERGEATVPVSYVDLDLVELLRPAEPVPPQREQPLGAYLRRWLDESAAPSLRPSTLRGTAMPSRTSPRSPTSRSGSSSPRTSSVPWQG